MRPGELLGLHWRDVSFEREELSVQRSLVRPTHGAAWLLEAPKTGRSRSLPLIAVAIQALHRHGDRQEADRLVAGERYALHGFVFADPSGEPLRADGVYKYHWVPTLQRLELAKVRLYDCRHSAATLLLEAGKSMKVVQELLGHASMTLTADTYSHVTPAFKRQAAKSMESYLSGP
jgi:integrase